MLSFKGDDLHGFVIEALLPPMSSAALCAEVGPALKTGEKKPIKCYPGTIGRIVRIRMTGTKPGTLTLCEVEVHGSKHHLFSLIY